MPIFRRHFCAQATAFLATPGLLWKGLAETAPVGASTARPNVAVIDRDRILRAAEAALQHAPQAPAAISTSTAKNEESSTGAPGSDSSARQAALLNLTLWVPALVAAYLLLRVSEPEKAGLYTDHAIKHLHAWFIDPATRLESSLPGNGGGAEAFERILGRVGLAETAVAVLNLVDDSKIDPTVMTALCGWFREYLEWLTSSRIAGLARDAKDHHGSSWLLQSCAFARLLADEASIAALRQRFERITIRAQILADGIFPHELTNTAPYRNSLFNLDMLAGVTELLSTRFESLWDYQLQDGPGMRVAIARYFPYIERRSAWPYPADISHFSELPCRRSSLLFSARAYSRPEYADVWRTLDPDPTDPVILAAFPIRQPLLWVSRPRT